MGQLHHQSPGEPPWKGRETHSTPNLHSQAVPSTALSSSPAGLRITLHYETWRVCEYTELSNNTKLPYKALEHLSSKQLIQILFFDIKILIAFDAILTQCHPGKSWQLAKITRLSSCLNENILQSEKLFIEGFFTTLVYCNVISFPTH